MFSLSSLEVNSVLLPAPGGNLSHIMLDEGRWDKDRSQAADTYIYLLIHQDAGFGFRSEKQGKGFHYWEDVNKTYGFREILPMPSMEAELEVSECVWASSPPADDRHLAKSAHTLVLGA